MEGLVGGDLAPRQRRRLLNLPAPEPAPEPQRTYIRGPWKPSPLDLTSDTVHTRLDVRRLAGLLDYELNAARDSGVRPRWDVWRLVLRAGYTQVAVSGTIGQVVQRPLAFQRVSEGLMGQGWKKALLPGFINPEGCAEPLMPAADHARAGVVSPASCWSGMARRRWTCSSPSPTL